MDFGATVGWAAKYFEPRRPFSSAVSIFFFKDPATTEIYTLSLHDALPTSTNSPRMIVRDLPVTTMRKMPPGRGSRSEEHTSELQSQSNLVCRLLLEKK